MFFFDIPAIFIYFVIVVAIVVGFKVQEVLSVILPIVGIIIGIIVVRKIYNYVADRMDDVTDYDSPDNNYD